MSMRSGKRIATAAAAALLFGVSPAGLASAGNANVHSFARAPSLALAALSPDGSFLSYVEQSGERQKVVVRALRDGSQQDTLKVESKRERVRWCHWAGSSHLLCGTISPVRVPDRISEKTRLYAIDVATHRVRELNTRLSDPARDQVIDFVSSRAGHVLLQHDPVGRGYPEVAEIDVASGALRRVVAARPPVRRWMSDGRGEVRLGIGYQRGVASLLVRRSEGGGWSVYTEQSLADLNAIGPIAFGSTSSDLYALKHHDGRAALFYLDLSRPAAPTLLFAHSAYDVAGPVILHPGSRDLLAVQYIAQHEERHFFDEQEAARQEWLDRQLPGAVNLVVDRTIGRRQLVRSWSDVDPPSLYLFDIEQQNLLLLGHEYPELEDQALASTRSMLYRARDGQVIPAYLTLPARGDRAQLPAVLLPHGGPEARVMKTFDPLVQFLAAQGYAVLQMNFRGSLGYGARFAAAGVGQWGGVIHNDITDGARWLVEEQVADPTRICIVGMSFGGYAALLGAARESEWYSCAASFAGATDLMAFAQYTERLDGADLWKERLGADQRALWQMSPMGRVRAIETPILLMHGRSDPVVPVSQSRRFARELKNAGKQYRFFERADCDHDMTIDSCRIAFFAELQQFLATSLEDRE